MKKFASIVDLLDQINIMHEYLDGRFPLDSEGWPIFQKSQFLGEWPKQVLTFDNRNRFPNIEPQDIVLCFYAPDDRIYPRFQRLEDDLPIYRQYMGVAFPDITVTGDMDEDWQETHMLANQLFAAVVALNGVKIICNTRNGTLSTLRCFRHIPRHVMCASGFLGCAKSATPLEAMPYLDKILCLMPEKLLIFGKRDEIVNTQLNQLGIDYKYYEDYHRQDKKERDYGRLQGRLL